MANLVIDIGNTAVKASWTEGITLGRSFRYQGEQVKEFILSLVEKEKPQTMVISSSYELSSEDIVVLEEKCDKLEILDKAHTRLLSQVGLPEYLGYDRAASVLAAKYLFKGKGCSVFDLGTTITVDFTDEQGKYLGGNISLGFRTRIKSLNHYSRSLPLIDTPQEAEIIGNSLESSMASGVISGIMFELSGYSGLYPGNIIVFTGGDANFFAKRMKNSIFVVCNLVLMGLALIADRYVKN